MNEAALPARWILFCEARSDAVIAQTHIDELIRLHCAQWVKDLLSVEPNSLRIWWQNDGADPKGFFNLHRYRELAQSLKVTVHHGHFNGEPQEPDAVQTETIFRIARELHHRAPREERPTALVILRDLDDEPTRRAGVAQVLSRGTSLPDDIACVIGLAEPEIEAWVLAGFEPLTAEEHNALENQLSELGFAPHEKAHELNPGRDDSKRSTKRICVALGLHVESRKEQCLQIPTEQIRDQLCVRGTQSGLAQWISDIEQKLLPQLDPQLASRTPSTSR